jgi:hypothetical protein
MMDHDDVQIRIWMPHERGVRNADQQVLLRPETVEFCKKRGRNIMGELFTGSTVFEAEGSWRIDGPPSDKCSRLVDAVWAGKALDLDDVDSLIFSGSVHEERTTMLESYASKDLVTDRTILFLEEYMKLFGKAAWQRIVAYAVDGEFHRIEIDEDDWLGTIGP